MQLVSLLINLLYKHDKDTGDFALNDKHIIFVPYLVRLGENCLSK